MLKLSQIYWHHNQQNYDDNVDNEKQWRDNFTDKKHYSHKKANSCGVAISFLGSNTLEVAETKINDLCRVLILDIKTCDKELLLVNLYDTNTEKEQLDITTTLSEKLNSFPNLTKQ